MCFSTIYVVTTSDGNSGVILAKPEFAPKAGEFREYVMHNEQGFHTKKYGYILEIVDTFKPY